MKKKLPKNKKSVNSSRIVLYFFFFVLILLALLTAFSKPQDIRNFAAPQPTPLYRCGTRCTGDTQCPRGLTCVTGVCRNPQCTGEADCACILDTSANPRTIPTPTTKSSGNKGEIIVLSPSPSFAPSTTLNPSVVATPTTVPENLSVPQKEATTKKESILDYLLRVVGDALCKLLGC